MKINELMVGDYCLAVDEDKKHKCIVSVLELRYDKAWLKVGIWGETLPYDRLEPIELTERILKENGFVYREEEETCATDAFHHWQLDGHSFALNSTQYFRKEKKDDMPRFDVAGIAIHYVHQLQHLLRLAGIEKEIEL